MGCPPKLEIPILQFRMLQIRFPFERMPASPMSSQQTLHVRQEGTRSSSITTPQVLSQAETFHQPHGDDVDYSYPNNSVAFC